MLNKKVNLKDLESVDTEFYNSIVWIQGSDFDFSFKKITTFFFL